MFHLDTLLLPAVPPPLVVSSIKSRGGSPFVECGTKKNPSFLKNKDNQNQSQIIGTYDTFLKKIFFFKVLIFFCYFLGLKAILKRDTFYIKINNDSDDLCPKNQSH